MKVSLALLKARLSRTKAIQKRLQLQLALLDLLMHEGNLEIDNEIAHALEEHTEANHEFGQASLLLFKGRLALRRGKLDIAENILLESLTYSEHLDDPQLHSNILSILSIVRREQGAYLHALSLAQEAADIQRQLQLYEAESLSLNSIARTLIAISDFSGALHYAMRGVDVARYAKSQKQEAGLLATLSDVKYMIGNHREALEILARVAKINEDLNNTEGLGWALGSMGLIYADINEKAKGIACLRKSLEILQQFDSGFGIAVCLANLAGQCLDVADEDAEEYARRAYEIAVKHGIKSIIRASLIIQGIVRQRRNEIDEARSYFMRALNLIEGNEASDHRIEILEHLVELSAHVKQFESALQFRNMLEEAKLFQANQQRDQKIQSIELRLQVARIEYERDTYRVKAERALATVEEHTRQIGTTLASLAERTRILSDLRKEVSALKIESSADVRFKRVLEELDEMLRSEERERNINSLLSQISEEYSEKLKRAYPALSKSELSVCMFLKVGFRSVDIAHMLKVSERTIENHRSHVRKKLRLARNESLSSVFEQLDRI